MAIVAARRQCDKLGVDCKTGQEIKSIQEQLINIEEKQALINAFVDLDKTKAQCKRLGIDCETGKKLKKKKKGMNIKPGKVPDLPKLLGYFDNKVLFTNGKGDVKSYQVDDELVSGYKVIAIHRDRYVALQYNEKTYKVE